MPDHNLRALCKCEFLDSKQIIHQIRGSFTNSAVPWLTSSTHWHFGSSFSSVSTSFQYISFQAFILQAPPNYLFSLMPECNYSRRMHSSGPLYTGEVESSKIESLKERSLLIGQALLLKHAHASSLYTRTS